MKKIALIFLILVSSLPLFGGKGPDFKRKILCNQEIIYHFEVNLDDIDSVSGKTSIEIPYEITPVKGAKAYKLNNQIFFYEVTYLGNTSKITIFPAKCKVVQFDFVEKKIKKGISKNSDALSLFRPSNLPEILAKHEGLKP